MIDVRGLEAKSWRMNGGMEKGRRKSLGEEVDFAARNFQNAKTASSSEGQTPRGQQNLATVSTIHCLHGKDILFLFIPCSSFMLFIDVLQHSLIDHSSTAPFSRKLYIQTHSRRKPMMLKFHSICIITPPYPVILKQM